MCATMVDEWVRIGVDVAMVAPGSRSTPMALALVAHPGMSTHVFIDERVASFAAVGAARVLRRPIIMLCTSGTAATEFHSAVVEAHQSDVPLIVITADRPPELRNVGAPQTIDQIDLYGTAVRRFVDLGVAEPAQRSEWRRSARNLVSDATGLRPGPVHVNMPFREPLLGEAQELPAVESGSESGLDFRTPLATDATVREAWRIMSFAPKGHSRGVIIAGEGADDVAEVAGGSSAVLELARMLGWPVWADPRSGLRRPHPNVVAAADAILRDDAVAERLRPSVVLRFGTLPASKVVGTWLREWGCPQVCVTAGPQLADPDRLVTHHVVGECADVARRLAALCAGASGDSGLDPDWLHQWMAASVAADLAIATTVSTGRLTEPGVAHVVVRDAPAPGVLVASSSMPVRDVEWYGAPRNGLKIVANRGANGIDGVMSSAIGAALVARVPVTLIIGDVAFLHDSGALVGLAERACDLRIVIVDNNGGAIFSFLPQASALSSTVFERLFGTPHTVDIELLARAHAVDYRAVGNHAALSAALAESGPSIIHVRTERTHVVADHDSVHRAVSDAVRDAVNLNRR